MYLNSLNINETETVQKDPEPGWKDIVFQVLHVELESNCTSTIRK